jgi:putative UDP-N-acetylglucosamine-peptide-n-acetylglucosaminyltransferase
LVFRKKFFSSQLEVIANPSKKLYNKKEKTESNKLNKLENASISLPIDKSTLQTLYRCIYLDPETGYWTLSQRDKSTFYRAHKNDVDMKEKWKKYYNELIPEKEENVEKYLFGHDDSVLSVLQSIFAKARSYNKDKNQKILEAVRFILLPLQYLVKHIAFQEEQECRIMYITQFRDEEIHSNREEQQMYVEYEEPVLPHIDKIYLSPGAAKYQDHFRILLDQGSGKSKVRISQNPFRNKE